VLEERAHGTGRTRKWRGLLRLVDRIGRRGRAVTYRDVADDGTIQVKHEPSCVLLRRESHENY
jgi:hypothetical protein